MQQSYETVCVVGLGYIGLPTASIMATKGFVVHGVDTNRVAVDTINQGSIHIHEPDLDILVKSAVNSGRLKAFLEPQPADVFILAVPTPFKVGHVPDMSYVEKAAKSIAPFIKPGNLVILESTSPVGSTEQVAAWIRETRPDLKIPTHVKPAKNTPTDGQVFFVHCPERVLPGQILRELVESDRIIGGIDLASARRAEAVYKKFVNGKLLLTDCRTAELCKLAENSFRDVNIAYANELSLICEKLNMDVWEVIRMANHHPRVKILQPGPGVGGHCIAVDPWFIVHSAPEQARLIRTAREVNNSKPHHVIRKVQMQAQRFKEPVIACLGLSFKADIDDIRESPAVEITEELARERVGRLMVVEPYLRELPESLRKYKDLEFADLDTALEAADIVLLLVNHREFAEVQRRQVENKIVIDTRGVWQ